MRPDGTMRRVAPCRGRLAISRSGARDVEATSQRQLDIESFAGARVLLVPINGTAVTLAALSLAARLAQMNRGKIAAIYVIVVARHLPLEAELPDEIEHSEAIFAQARDALHERHTVVEFALLQARNAGATIVDEAVNVQADAIVLGIGDKHHVGEGALGQTAEYVLKHVP